MRCSKNTTSKRLKKEILVKINNNSNKEMLIIHSDGDSDESVNYIINLCNKLAQK